MGPFHGRLVPGAATVVWVAVLVYLALLPRIPRVPGIPESYLSIAAHFATHFILVGLIYWWLTGQRAARRSRVKAGLIAVSLSAAFGLVSELLQLTTHGQRVFELKDLSADVIGATVAVLVLANAEILHVSRKVTSSATVLAACLFGSCAVATAAIWNPAYPYQGDHWHAQYLLYICGERQPPFDTFPGGIHSHGDTLIHIHPVSSHEEGTNATIGLFFEEAGGRLSDDELVLPGGESFENGALCPDGSAGTVRISQYDPATHQRVARVGSDHVLKDGETLLIEFVSN